MADIEMRLEGFERLERKLRRIPEQVRTQAVPKALRAAAIVGRRAIRNATPVGPTGNLRRSTTFRIRRYSRVTVAIIGHKWDSGPHAHLIEEGTQERTRETIGGFLAAGGTGDDPRSKSTGRVQATHFMKRAFKAIEGRLGVLYAQRLIKEAETLMRRQ
jgi:HK97 gp10 family phage protein